MQDDHKISVLAYDFWWRFGVALSSASVSGRTGVLYARKFDQNAQNKMARRIRVSPK